MPDQIPFRQRLETGIVCKLASVFLVLIFSVPVQSQHQQHQQHQSSPVLDRDKSLAFSQSVVGQSPSNYTFTNQDRKTVSIYDYRGKPLVVNFIYTSCYHTCPVMTTHLKNTIEIAREALGDESFSMVSIGFDIDVDTPEKMRLFATQRGVDFDGWDFLSGDMNAIHGITGDLGFSYVASPNGFDHLAQTTVLDANGVVYRQVYGANFETPALVEPLKELVFGSHTSSGTVDQWLNGIRLFCTIYDPSSNRYYFDYSIFYIIGIGLLCLTSILVFVIRNWHRDNKNASKIIS